MEKTPSAMEKKYKGYTVDERSPPVRTTDLNNGLVKVEMLIPLLELGRDKYTPKGGKVSFDFNNSGNSFDMEAVFKDKIKKKVTIYKFKVKQLPGRVDTQESKWNVYKGKIEVIMEKHAHFRNVDWNKAAWERGLDQASSSSSSDDD